MYTVIVLCLLELCNLSIYYTHRTMRTLPPVPLLLAAAISSLRKKKAYVFSLASLSFSNKVSPKPLIVILLKPNTILELLLSVSNLQLPLNDVLMGPT